MTRQGDFAAKHGYTMEQVESAVMAFLLRSKSPVWSPSHIAYRLYQAETNEPAYRHVLRAVHNLREKGLVKVENWSGANNVTVVYAVQRFVEPIMFSGNDQ